MPIPHEELLQQLKDIRLEKKMSTTGLAKKVGISQSYLARIERGKSRCSVPLLLKICAALKVTIAILPEKSDLFKTNLTPEEKILVDEFRNSSKKMRESILGILKKD